MSDSATAVVPALAADSPLEALRAEFAKKIEPKRLFKKLPRAKLVGEFKIARKDDARKAAETFNDEFLLAECLVALHVETPKGLVPLGEYVGKPGEDPLKFDGRTAGILGVKFTTPAALELTLFGDNDLQIAQLCGEVAEWSLDSENESFQDFPSAD